jgi:hypothetical protein
MMILSMAGLTLALAAQTVALQPSEPITIFAPYVGNWSCTETTEREPVRVSAFLFDLDHQLLRETIITRESPAEPRGEATSAAFGFDAKTGRYVEIEMISGGHWYASTAEPPDDGVFHWTDTATSETPSRWTMTLPKNDAFIIESFGRSQDKSPLYRADCKRKTH